MGTMQRKVMPVRLNLEKAMKDLDGIECQVGWFSSAKYEDGTPVAYVASIQEFGHGPIPPRSFMRTTQAERGGYWQDLVGAATKGVTEGRRSAADVMELLGSQAAGDVRAKIASIQEPALAPGTIAARKRAGNSSTKPLVDERIMINTLTHQVTTK